MDKVKKSSKVFLSHKQLLELMDITINTLVYLENVRDENEDPVIKESIKNIQVPVRLSESIALRLLYDNHIKFEKYTADDYKYGAERGDFDIENDNGIKKLNIEVKATGSDIFQRFREHALKSDFTIWIDFYGLREKEISSNIRFFVLKTKLVKDARKKKKAKEKAMDVEQLIGPPFNVIPREFDINKLAPKD